MKWRQFYAYLAHAFDGRWQDGAADSPAAPAALEEHEDDRQRASADWRPAALRGHGAGRRERHAPLRYQGEAGASRTARSRSTRSVTSRAMATEPTTCPASSLTSAKDIST